MVELEKEWPANLVCISLDFTSVFARAKLSQGMPSARPCRMLQHPQRS